MTIQRLWTFLSAPHVQRTASRFITSFMLLLLVVMGLPALSGAQICPPDGDVDRNGSVTAADALLAFQQALGLAQLDACQQSIADVSSDGSITASDALCIFQKALSLPSCLDTLPSSNQPPVANAGLDQIVDVNDAVTLSGSGSDSDGTIVAYHWVQTVGTFVTLSGANTRNATFTATVPEDVIVEDLEFQLTVTDDDGASATDTVVVTVFRDYLIVDNDPPMADAGADQTVDENTLVTLSGSGTDPDGFIVHYGWLQTGGTTVLLLGADTPNPSFTAPDVSFDEELVFELTVYDDDSALATDSVTITVVEPEPGPQPPGEQHALKVSVFGEGDIRVGGVGDPLDCTVITICQGFFDEGSEVVVEAVPDSDWTHERWVGCDEVDNTQCTIFMDDDRFVSVTFLSTTPLEIEDSVVVLQDEQLDGIIQYDLDDGRLVFDPSTDGVSEWAIGDILLSDGYDTDESMAFARRIISIREQPNRVTFNTSQASLDDIFRSGSFSFHGQGHDSGSQQSNSPIVAQSDGRSFPVDITGDVAVSGAVQLPMDPEFAINFSPLEFRIIGHTNPTGSITIETSGQVEREGEKELGSINFGTIPIGYGITVNPELEAIATYVAEAAGGIETTFHYSISASAGVHYKDGQGLKPIFKASVDPSSGVSLPELDLELHAETGLRLELEFKIQIAKFQFVAGAPHVGFGPTLGIQSECNATYANVYGGLRLTLGGELNVLSNSLRLDFPAWQRKWALDTLYPPGKTPPEVVAAIVTGLEVTDVTRAGWTLVWDPPRNQCGIAGYVIYRDDHQIARGISELEMTEEDLTPGTRYCYQVAPITVSGVRGSKSSPRCFVFDPFGYDLHACYTQTSVSVPATGRRETMRTRHVQGTMWGPGGTTLKVGYYIYHHNQYYEDENVFPPLQPPHEYGVDCGSWNRTFEQIANQDGSGHFRWVCSSPTDAYSTTTLRSWYTELRTGYVTDPANLHPQIDATFNLYHPSKSYIFGESGRLGFDASFNPCP